MGCQSSEQVSIRNGVGQKSQSNRQQPAEKKEQQGRAPACCALLGGQFVGSSLHHAPTYTAQKDSHPSVAAKQGEAAPAGDEALQGSGGRRQRDQHGQGTECAQAPAHAAVGALGSDPQLDREDGGDGGKGDGAHQACGALGGTGVRVHGSEGSGGSGILAQSQLSWWDEICHSIYLAPSCPPVMTWKKGIRQATNVMRATKAERQARRRVRPVSQTGQEGQASNCSSTRQWKGMLDGKEGGEGRRRSGSEATCGSPEGTAG